MLPCLITDASLRIVWRNRAADEIDSGFRFPDGMLGWLSGYDMDALLERLRAGESLQLFPTLPPFTRAPLTFTPCLEDHTLIGVVVVLSTAPDVQPDAAYSERESSAFSHNYRAPLSMIFAVLPPLYKRMGLEDRQAKEYLQHIAVACYQMLRTTANITDYTRLVGAPLLRMRNGDFVSLVRDLCEGAAAFIEGEPRLFFRYSLPDLPVITAFDPIEMSTAILHLILNAAHSRKQGNIDIRLSLSVEGTSLHLSVADNGSGISPADLPHIFEPYVSSHYGIGLGLPLTRSIITAHGGTLAVESLPDQGTTMAFYLPIRPDYNLPDYASQAIPQLEDHFSPLYLHLASLRPELLLSSPDSL